ncbi:hypothetical protein C8F01DRAFT_1171186 [Mycena amicta]|nr:hypothetical protein C8F01DRAFT_1171186 [Mycena amicta]
MGGEQGSLSRPRLGRPRLCVGIVLALIVSAYASVSTHVVSAYASVIVSTPVVVYTSVILYTHTLVIVSTHIVSPSSTPTSSPPTSSAPTSSRPTSSLPPSPRHKIPRTHRPFPFPFPFPFPLLYHLHPPHLYSILLYSSVSLSRNHCRCHCISEFSSAWTLSPCTLPLLHPFLSHSPIATHSHPKALDTTYLPTH